MCIKCNGNMFLGIQYKIERAIFLTPQKIFKSKFETIPELNIYNKLPPPEIVILAGIPSIK